MDFERIYHRSYRLIRHPSSEWDAIRNEVQNERTIMLRFVLPLMGMVSVTRLAGLLINFRYYSPSGWQLFVDPALVFIVCFVFFAVSVFTVYFLLSVYHPGASFHLAMTLTSYSLTVFFIASAVSNLLPELAVFLVFSFYSIYLLFSGAKRLTAIQGAEQLRTMQDQPNQSLKKNLQQLIRNPLVQFTAFVALAMVLTYTGLSLLYNLIINLFSFGHQAVNTLLLD